MSDAHQVEEAVDEGQQVDPQIESKARDMGWVPEKEWKGAPPKHGFASAEEFLKRGEEVLPIIRKQLERREQQIANLEAKIEKAEKAHSDTIRRIERMSSVALEKQREQIEAQYTARIEAATELGDKDAVRQARKDEKEALKALDERLEEPKEDKDKREKESQKLPKHVEDTLEAWISDNQWFKSEPEMQMVANNHHAKLLKEKPGLTLAENLAEVRKYVAKRYPEAFAKDDEEEEVEEKPRRGSAVEGGSRMSGAGGRSLYSKLPPEAKEACDRFVKQGLFAERGESIEKDAPKMRERYATEYFKDSK